MSTIDAIYRLIIVFTTQHYSSPHRHYMNCIATSKLLLKILLHNYVLLPLKFN